MLKNIEYLTDVPDALLEEMTYMLELTHINEGTFLIKRGTQWKEIHIIWNGEIDVYIGNNKRENILDTLYTGWSIGSYYSLTSDDYIISAKAKTDWTVLKFDCANLINLRDRYDKLDENVEECENYVIENGLPYCDYKMFRTRQYKSTPSSKFQSGVRRIMSIVRTYKPSALQDLLEKVRNLIREK